MQDHTFKKVIVSNTATPGSNYAPEKIALFDEAGERVTIPSQVSLNSQYRRVITPQMYGAKGDGSTDDTVALQAAFSAASTGRCSLFIPAVADCYVFSTISLTGEVSLDVFGESYSMRSGAGFGDSQWVTPGVFRPKGSVLRSTATSGNAITVGDGTTAVLSKLSSFLVVGPGSGSSTGTTNQWLGGLLQNISGDTALKVSSEGSTYQGFHYESTTKPTNTITMPAGSGNEFSTWYGTHPISIDITITGGGSNHFRNMRLLSTAVNIVLTAGSGSISDFSGTAPTISGASAGNYRQMNVGSYALATTSGAVAVVAGQKVQFDGGSGNNYIKRDTGTGNTEIGAGSGITKATGKIVAATGIGVGNSASASALGTLSKKMEVFDASGASLGFVPIYTTIT